MPSLTPLAEKYGAWCKKAEEGSCETCETEGLVYGYDDHRTDKARKVYLCFLCAHVVSAHLLRDQEKTILSAMSMLLQIAVKPKQPPKPRAPRLMKPYRGT